MSRALVLHPADNVATLLSGASRGGRVALLGERKGEIEAASDVPSGHKIALRSIREGELVVKYGEPIGGATADILFERGELVAEGVANGDSVIRMDFGDSEARPRDGDIE
ncbi:MAG: UxaA family hydrolase, partial [Firmicutes bacterium]|nr:UxaA family hydrolase [Bacillota bacterium]